MPVLHCRNHAAVPAAVRIDYRHEGPLPPEGLCAKCAECTVVGCPNLSTILDPEYGEPWCAADAAQFNGEEAIDGHPLIPVTESGNGE